MNLRVLFIRRVIVMEFMQRALELAKLGEGCTNPSPFVGAVIVKDGKIIGEGYRVQCGEDHATINALKNSQESVKGATLYINLEPCAHEGQAKTCASAIVESGIAKVVVGMEDPDPEIAGQGIAYLKEHGIEVETGVLEAESKHLNRFFSKYDTTKMPYCILKTTMTLDGKAATYTRTSQWIFGKEARYYVQQLRHRVSAIMVSTGTVLADDPLLTTRLEEGRDAHRIIMDTSGKVPLTAKVYSIQSDADTIVVTTEQMPEAKRSALVEKGIKVIIAPVREDKVDIEWTMKTLGEMGINSILLEAGGEFNYTALKLGLVDEVNFFIAPIILGGRDVKTPVEGDGISGLQKEIDIESMKIHHLGKDIMVEGYINKN